jgi:hypothetical protein
MPELTLFQWFQGAMAVVTVVPFLGVFTRLVHSYRYATFMSSWSAGTMFWVFWLMGRLSTFEYFLSLGITCFFPMLWFYRTRLSKSPTI